MRWLCKGCGNGKMHLSSGCQMHTGNEYLKRHNNFVMTTWTVEEGVPG